MKLCIVGIGGAGGKIAQEFLGNDDLDSRLLSRLVDAEYISAGGIKGIWLEADKNDAKNLQHFFRDLTEGAYPGFFIPHDVVPDSSDVHIRVREKYGYDVKKQGFVRDAQYLKAIFEIFDTDKEIQQIAAGIGGQAETGSWNSPSAGEETNHIASNSAFKQIPNPIFDSAWEVIRPYTTLGGGECDGILFIVSFGGGTGTGFINPIINHIRNEGKADYPVFVLGVLTEQGDFADRAQFSKEGRRNLAAISAIYDLLTNGSGANGVILVDNQILLEKFGNDYTSANRFIYRIMQPIVAARNYPGEQPPSQAIAQNFSRGLSRPALFVPLYWSQPRRSNPEEDLVRKALTDGRLFGCAPEKADWAMVFCRGFIDSEKVRLALSAHTGLKPENIWVLRKMGEGNDEILILLRNPYGADPEAHKKEGTLENRLCKVITLALQYMNQSAEDLFYEGKASEKAAAAVDDLPVRLTPPAKMALSQFFFGPEGFVKDNFGKTEGFAFQLREARLRLRAGEKPFFLYPLRIFQKEAKVEVAIGMKVVEGSGLDEKRILEIVNRRLAEIGLTKEGLH
jgi:hypothetical protein